MSGSPHRNINIGFLNGRKPQVGIRCGGWVRHRSFPSESAEEEDPMSRIQIRLKKIHCYKTEDFGADEFYIIAGFKKNSSAKPLAVYKGIWDLNNTDSVSPDVLLFDEEVDTNEEAIFQIFCFDQDASEEIKPEDLKKAGDMVEEMINKIQEHRESNGKQPASGGNLAVMAVEALISIIGFLVSLDKDDLLGDHQETIPTPTWWQSVNPVGATEASHDTQFKCLYQGSNYDVHYNVKVIY
jgi:hypothetical protein